jgi:hypothetical protein
MIVDVMPTDASVLGFRPLSAPALDPYKARSTMTV